MALNEILNELGGINAYLTHNKNPTLSPADFWVLSRFSLIPNHAKIPHKAISPVTGTIIIYSIVLYDK